MFCRVRVRDFLTELLRMSPSILKDSLKSLLSFITKIVVITRAHICATQKCEAKHYSLSKSQYILEYLLEESLSHRTLLEYCFPQGFPVKKKIKNKIILDWCKAI